MSKTREIQCLVEKYAPRAKVVARRVNKRIRGK